MQLKGFLLKGYKIWRETIVNELTLQLRTTHDIRLLIM